LKDRIREEQIKGNPAEVDALEKQLAAELRRLQMDCEEKKEKLRASFAK
jgi:septin family protein